jgi:hypothetical protein
MVLNTNPHTTDDLKVAVQQRCFQSPQKLFKVYYGISSFDTVPPEEN